jgi:hypothetical protein
MENKREKERHMGCAEPERTRAKRGGLFSGRKTNRDIVTREVVVGCAMFFCFTFFRPHTFANLRGWRETTKLATVTEEKKRKKQGV